MLDDEGLQYALQGQALRNELGRLGDRPWRVWNQTRHAFESVAMGPLMRQKGGEKTVVIAHKDVAEFHIDDVGRILMHDEECLGGPAAKKDDKPVAKKRQRKVKPTAQEPCTPSPSVNVITPPPTRRTSFERNITAVASSSKRQLEDFAYEDAPAPEPKRRRIESAEDSVADVVDYGVLAVANLIIKLQEAKGERAAAKLARAASELILKLASR